jgi:hypothetical protein
MINQFFFHNNEVLQGVNGTPDQDADQRENQGGQQIWYGSSGSGTLVVHYGQYSASPPSP